MTEEDKEDRRKEGRHEVLMGGTKEGKKNQMHIEERPL